MRAEEIVEQFEAPVRRWFARRVTDRGDAEDLAQETILAAIEALPGFRGDSSPRTWVYAIARNQLLKYIRGARLRPLPLSAMRRPSSAGARDGRAERHTGLSEPGLPPGCLDRSDAHNAYDAAQRITVEVIVSHLPVALREVYKGFYCDGLTTAQIARGLQRSQGTVKYQLYEIRRRVKRALVSG